MFTIQYVLFEAQHSSFFVTHALHMYIFTNQLGLGITIIAVYFNIHNLYWIYKYIQQKVDDVTVKLHRPLCYNFPIWYSLILSVSES